MKAERFTSWFFECVAALLAAYSLCVVFWMFREGVRDIVRPTLSAGPGGMPGNTAAGVGIAIWLGSGVAAAVLAYPIALMALPEDKTAVVWRMGKLVQKTAIVGFVAPFAIFGVAMLFE